MDDDELFERKMTALGVEPLDEEQSVRQRRRGEALSDEDQRLFDQAMLELGGEVTPDQRASPRSPVRAPRKVKARRRERIEEQIDLHRLKSAEALGRLEAFVTRARASGVRTVLVITGKGLHSPGGQSVLKRRVEEWLGARGRRSVLEFSDAPRTHGGRGAYVFYLRPIKTLG